MPMWMRKRFALMEEANGGEGGGSGGGEGSGGDKKTGGEGGDGGEGKKTGDNKPSDAEAKLLQDVMKKKERVRELEAKLKDYEGVDPNEFKKLKQAQADAEAARKEQETKELEKRGEFDRLRKQMLEEHDKALKAVRDELEAARGNLGATQSQIMELTVGSSFSGSKFISEELTLTPTKARAVYGAHFEVKDGVVVAYDKPAGSSNRTLLVDGRGEALSFDEAIKKLVEIDPDRDSLLKAKVKPGSGAGGGGSGAGSGKSPASDTGASKTSGLGRIQEGLSKQFKTLV